MGLATATLFVLFALPTGESDVGRTQEFPTLAACEQEAQKLRAATTGIRYECHPHRITDELLRPKA